MDEKQISNIVEQYSRSGSEYVDDIRITQLPDWKSVFVETTVDSGRTIFMSEYEVDGKNYWAGFSSRSQTVYVSNR